MITEELPDLRISVIELNLNKEGKTPSLRDHLKRGWQSLMFVEKDSL